MSAPIVLSFTSTKGGVGKTTLTANLAGLPADLGLRVLMIDADVQPSLSKYFPLSHQAENGIVELLLGENSESVIRSTVSSTVFPNLTSPPDSAAAPFCRYNPPIARCGQTVPGRLKTAPYRFFRRPALPEPTPCRFSISTCWLSCR
uniref:ParA family protein n=1 Tax=Neisseria leonii TaxID=2995413 RepID=UPI003F5829B6